MNNKNPFSPITNEFFTLLGQLINLRIKRYIRKHHRDSESEFVNNFFIVVYDLYDYDKDELRYSAATKKHFQENIGLEFTQIELNSVMLNDKKEIMYFFTIFPDFLSNDYDGDYFSFTLTNDILQPIDYRQCQGFMDVDDEHMKNLITKINAEIMFETIKSS